MGDALMYGALFLVALVFVGVTTYFFIQEIKK